MFKLLQNENMKLYSRLGTWLMFALVILAVAGIGFLNNYEQPVDSSQWRTEIQQTNIQLKEALQKEKDPLAIKQFEDRLKVNEYSLTHDIAPIQYSIWGFANDFTNFVGPISLFVIVVAGGIVANEFSWGTVKFLLVKPFSRSKILLAKYLCVMQFALFMLITLLVSAVLTNGVLTGFTPIHFSHLSVDAQGVVQESNIVLYLLSKYGLSSIELIFVATIAFMLSTVFRNPSLAIGISIVLLILGGTITALLASKYWWIKYTLFANTSLSQYMGGTPLIEGMTLGFSLTVLLIHYVVFMATTWTVFNKRDVAT